MDEFSIAFTMIVSLLCVYYLLLPFLRDDSSYSSIEETLNYEKEIAIVLLEELKDLTDQKESGQISEEDFRIQKALLLKDASSVV